MSNIHESQGDAPVSKQPAQPPIVPPPVSEVTKQQPSLHRQRLVIGVLGAFGISSLFLPWIYVPTFGSLNGVTLQCAYWVFLFLPALILALFGNKSKPLVGKSRLWAAIPSGAAALIGIVLVAQLQTIWEEVALVHVWFREFPQLLGMPVQTGFGLYLMVATGLMLFGVAWAMADDDEAHRIKMQIRKTFGFDGNCDRKDKEN